MLATEPKTMRTQAKASAERSRIAQLAESAALVQAQRWLTRERAWINEQQLQLCRVPAPTFFEQQRAEWFRAQLETLGWKARMDRAGNVLATFGEETPRRSFVVSAHLDTVLAPARAEGLAARAQRGRHPTLLEGTGGGRAALILPVARRLSSTIVPPPGGRDEQERERRPLWGRDADNRAEPRLVAPAASGCGATRAMNSRELITLVFFQNRGKWRWFPVTR